jgi:hypothetical protein
LKSRETNTKIVQRSHTRLWTMYSRGAAMFWISGSGITDVQRPK